ncbi:MAG: ABATE domain-containing protein [Nocardioidaceae bacterium]
MSSPKTDAPLLGEPLPVELMNTIWADRDGVHDALGSPAATRAWLRSVTDREDVSGADVTAWLGSVSEDDLAAVHRDLRALRDAARRLAARRTDDTRESALMDVEVATAITSVNAFAASAPAWPVLDWPDEGRPHVSRGSESAPAPVFVADMARATVALLGGDTGHSLRACQAPGCVLYFIKQHPRRQWCSAGCGNRARQARHYRRHHHQH